jgi:diguanylate cyclase (GGDEF)-like protein
MTMSDQTRTIRLPAVSGPGGGSDRGGHAYVALVAGHSTSGFMFKVDRELILGRAGDAQVFLDDADVSRHHAKLVPGPGGMVSVVDLGSTNGTAVNGVRLEGSRPLLDGDQVTVGQATFLKFTHGANLEEAWRRNAFDAVNRDGLTHLYSRRYLEEQARHELAYADRHHAPLSLALLDVDRLGELNGTHGAGAGDAVLQQMALRLARCVRAEDVLARHAGGTLALLMRQTGEAQAVTCVERLRCIVEVTEFTAADKAVKVTVSGGVAQVEVGKHRTVADLVAAAAARLAEAKDRGRNRVAPGR